MGSDRVKWPPEKWADVQDRYKEWGAWYSGNRKELMDTYLNQAYESTDDSMFWAAELDEDESRTMIHVPIAGDIAQASADLVLGQQIQFKVGEAHEEDPDEDAKKAQDRLREITRKVDLFGRATKAAETAAILGGVYGKVNWDTDFKSFPVLNIVQPYNVIPYFKWGFLKKAIFHRVLGNKSGDVYRHLETHATDDNGEGVIYNQLFEGTSMYLGDEVPLEARPETEDKDEEIRTGVEGLTCRYIPNKRPNRLFTETPKAHLGQSDIQGSEDILDSIDQVFSDWVRDIRLARSRIMVPEVYLELNREDGEMEFPLDKEIFTPMNMGPAGSENQDIKLSQFDIRAEQHKNTLENFIIQAVDHAGYAPQTFGLKIEGKTESGKALSKREDQTKRTTEKKQKYIKRKLSGLAEVILEIDREHFGGVGIQDYSIVADFVQPDGTSDRERAETIKILDQGTAVSTKVKVRKAHPEWSEEQVNKETERLMEEQGMAVTNPDDIG